MLKAFRRVPQGPTIKVTTAGQKGRYLCNSNRNEEVNVLRVALYLS